MTMALTHKQGMNSGGFHLKNGVEKFVRHPPPSSGAGMPSQQHLKGGGLIVDKMSLQQQELLNQPVN